MNYSVNTTVEPVIEPITLEEAKSHERYPFNDQDSNISRIYIPAARRRVEDETNRQLITATLELALDDFPSGTEPIRVPRAPLQSVSSITYVDSAGDRQTLATADYVVDTRDEPGLIFPTYGKIWPTTRKRTESGTVLVTFVAGYGTTEASVPAGLREAMLLMFGHYFAHREEVIIGTIPSELPRAVRDLLNQHSYGDEFTEYGAC